MTDARNDQQLEAIVRKLPKRSGIIFRHYHLEAKARKGRFFEIRKLADRYGHILLLAGEPGLARKWRADGVHGRHWRRRETVGLMHSAPVHDAREIEQAIRGGADLYFLSPIHATRSHQDARPLNPVQVKQLMGRIPGKTILLGGMTAKRYRQLSHLHAHGWAAIDGLNLAD